MILNYKKMFFAIGCFMAMAVSVAAQVTNPSSFDLQFANPNVSCASGLFCADVQVKASDGAPNLAFGSHTIGFSYNAAAINEPVYTASSFNPSVICTGPGGFNYNPYLSTNFSYSETGIPALANLTTNLNFFIPGFECPIITQTWTTMGQVCFTIADPTAPVDLSFDTALTIANLSTNTPAHTEGTFSTLLITPQSITPSAGIRCLGATFTKN